MALDLGSSRMPDDPGWYQFWSDYTAAQARNTAHPARVIDRRVRRMFRDLCQMIEPTLAVELGAHDGRFSRWAKRTFPEARCLALEANPYVHSKHRERMAEIGVDYRLLAASASNGTVTINIPLQIGGKTKHRSTRLASLAIHRDAVEHETVEVESVRVDDLVDVGEHDRVVAWVDVEGGSDAVLTGGRDVLARADAVFIEVESVEVWTGQWLDVDVARFLRSIGKVPAVRDIQRPHQYNVAFVSQDLTRRDDVAERAARVLRPPRKVLQEAGAPG
jgi:FkbM family methyltransferase